MTTRFKWLPDVGNSLRDDGAAGVHVPEGDWISGVPGGALIPSAWWDGSVRAGLPAPAAPWQIRPIPAGLWLFRGRPSVREAEVVVRIPADPARLGLVVGAAEPNPGIFDAISHVLAGLPGDGPRAVRIFLPFVTPEAGRSLARDHRLDLVAAPAGLRFRGGIAGVCAAGAAGPEGFWQWYRTRSGDLPQPCGAIYPQPGWEAGLVGHSAFGMRSAAVAGRIPAGFALRPLGPIDSGFARFAAEVPADSERLRVVVQGNGFDPLLMAACRELLDALPLAATRHVQLVWPYAGARESSVPLRELAALLDAPVVAPAAGITLHPNGHDLMAAHEGARWGTGSGSHPIGTRCRTVRCPRHRAGDRSSVSGSPPCPREFRPHRPPPVSTCAARGAPAWKRWQAPSRPNAEVSRCWPMATPCTAVIVTGCSPRWTGSAINCSGGQGGDALGRRGESHCLAQVLADRLNVRLLAATTESIVQALGARTAGYGPLRWFGGVICPGRAHSPAVSPRRERSVREPYGREHRADGVTASYAEPPLWLVTATTNGTIRSLSIRGQRPEPSYSLDRTRRARVCPIGEPAERAPRIPL